MKICYTLFLIVTVFTFLFNVGITNATWYNTTFTMMRTIPIQWAGQDWKGRMDGYQLFINVTYDSDMSSDFSDLRFVNHADNSEISYWIENYTASNFADVWLKLLIMLNTTNTTIDMYYKNSTPVGSLSNGVNTFLLFDNFDGSTLDQSKFTNDTTFTINNGVITAVGKTGSFRSINYSEPIFFKSRFYLNNTYLFGLTSDLGMINSFAGIQFSSPTLYTETSNDGVSVETNRGAFTGNTWYIYRIKVNSTMAEYFLDSNMWNTSTTVHIPIVPLGAGLYVVPTLSPLVDWVLIANSTEKLPIYTIGEEQGSTSPTFVQVNGITNGTYPDTKTISCSGSSACTLWKNATNVTAQNNTAFQLAAGLYNFTASINNGASNQTTVIYYITRNNNGIVLNLTYPPSPVYPDTTKVTCTGASQLPIHLYNNDTLWDAYNGTIVILGAGNYWFNCNATFNQNYSGTNMQYDYTISKSTDPNLNLYNKPNTPINYGTLTVSNCTGVPEVYPHLYKNSTDWSTYNGTGVVLPVGDNLFVCNGTESQNYTGFGYLTEHYIVNAPPATFVNVMNITNNTANSKYPANITIYCIGSSICTLWYNGTNVTTQNNTLLWLPAGTHNITASITGNQSTVWYKINRSTTLVGTYPFSGGHYYGSTVTPYIIPYYGTGINIPQYLANAKMYWNNTDITTLNGTAIFFPVGRVNLTGVIYDSQNFTGSGAWSQDLDILKNNSVITAFSINGSYASFNDTIMLTVTAPDNDIVNVTVNSVNRTLSWNGTHYIYYFSNVTLGLTPSTFYISRIYFGGNNYTLTFNDTIMSFDYGLTNLTVSIFSPIVYDLPTEYQEFTAIYETSKNVPVIPNCTLLLAGTTYPIQYIDSVNAYVQDVSTFGWSPATYGYTVSCFNSSYQSQSIGGTFRVVHGGGSSGGGGGGGGGGSTTFVYVTPANDTFVVGDNVCDKSHGETYELLAEDGSTTYNSDCPAPLNQSEVGTISIVFLVVASVGLYWYSDQNKKKKSKQGGWKDVM